MSVLRGYSLAVAWIAGNDGNGDEERLEEEHVAGMVTVLLVADLYRKTPEQVAKAIVRLRRKMDDENNFPDSRGGFSAVKRH
jgi:hypothetical protein